MIDKFGRQKILKKTLKLKRLEGKVKALENICLDYQRRLDELLLHVTILQSNVNTIERERIHNLEMQLTVMKNQLFSVNIPP